MSIAVKRASPKVYSPKKKITVKPTKGLSPLQIGYYGRSITKLNKGELISALTELAEMYKDVKEKLKRFD